MASLNDIPFIIRTIGAWPFAQRIWGQIVKDNIFTWGSALAYSWLFAIFPFLIFLTTLIPLLPKARKDEAMAQIRQVVNELPEGAREAILSNIKDLLSRPQGSLLSVGLVVAVWAASGGMAATMQALDKAYDIKKTRSYIVQRIIALGLTILVAGMILVVTILLPVGGIAINWMVKQSGIFSPLLLALDFVRYAIALILMFGVLAVIYRFAPSRKQRWHFITPGAVFSIVVWLGLGMGFRFYVEKLAFSSYNKTYGALGGVVILLFFFYIDAVVLLVGAEINSEIDFAVTGHRGEFSGANRAGSGAIIGPQSGSESSPPKPAPPADPPSKP